MKSCEETEAEVEVTSAAWHYAPIAGEIGKKVDGEWIKLKSWDERHQLLNEFLALREAEKIELRETVNYGHPFFHGHSGRVDIYYGR